MLSLRRGSLIIKSTRLGRGWYACCPSSVCISNKLVRPLRLFKIEPLSTPINFKDIKCDNNHITWPKNEFVERLSEEVKRISLISTGDANQKSHKNAKNDFHQLAAAIERLLSLQTWDEVDATANKFKHIDPDRTKASVALSMNDTENGTESRGDQLKGEKYFLKHMAPYLKQAGYSEISQKEVKDLLMTHHRYGDVELKVEFNDFDFIRVWVFGRSESSAKERMTLKSVTEKQWKKFNSVETYDPGSELCHRRVVIAAKSKESRSMIFKCFKDVPVGHFEALIPQAKINIPWKQKWFWNIFLFSSGVGFFFNIGLWLQSEQKLGLLLISTIVMAFLVYRSRVVYRNVRNRYNLLWKQMLYYKSTSNNSALALEILNRARGQNFKNTILTYVAALHVANRSKGKGATTEQIMAQCDVWFQKATYAHPERAVGMIDLSIGIRNLLSIGILTCTNNNQTFDVADVAPALKKVRDELMSLCAEICDSN